MNQDDLNAFHGAICNLMQMWVDQLITDLELAKAMAKIFSPALADFDGLIDPNTGLRYITKQGA